MLGAGERAASIWAIVGGVSRPRALSWTLAVASLALLIASVYRAATFSFTHEESLSFINHVATQTPLLDLSSNDQPLNTLLMRLCRAWFGPKPLALRAPNLILHAVYLYCVWALLRRFQSPLVKLTGFAVLNLCPFLLDFFFLALGYGLALGLEALSLYTLVSAYDRCRTDSFPPRMAVSIVSGALMVFANFAFLNCYLPLLVVQAWLTFQHDRPLGRQPRSLNLPALAFLFSAGLLGVIIPNLSKQQGAAGGFVADTIGTLVACSLYKAPYTDALGPLISSMLVLAIILLVLAGALTLVTKRFESLFGLVALVLGLAFAAPTALQALLHTPFPVEQKALYYVPLFGFALVFGLDWLATTPGPRHSAVASTVLSACIAVACTGHFAGSYSVETCYNWWFDRHNGKVLRAINRDRRAHCRDCTIHIGNGWIQEPSLNFYRIARNYTWLAPIKRQSLRGPENQYLYGFAHDMPEPIDPRAKILSFSDTNTVLVRVGSASVTSTP